MTSFRDLRFTEFKAHVGGGRARNDGYNGFANTQKVLMGNTSKNIILL